MDVTEGQYDKFLQHLKQKWASPNCPVCHQSNWAVNSKVFELREYNTGSLVVGGLVFPVVLLTCQSCAHTLMFSALKAGVIEAPKNEEKHG